MCILCRADVLSAPHAHDLGNHGVIVHTHLHAPCLTRSHLQAAIWQPQHIVRMTQDAQPFNNPQSHAVQILTGNTLCTHFPLTAHCNAAQDNKHVHNLS